MERYGAGVLFDIYGAFLTDKQREMFNGYYNLDISLSELAENNGISRQGVRDAIKKAEQTLLDCEQKLGLKRRIDNIANILRDVKTDGQIGKHYNEFCERILSQLGSF